MKTKIGALVATVAAAASAAGATVWARRKRDGKADAKRAKRAKAKPAAAGAAKAGAAAGATEGTGTGAREVKAGATTADAGAASGAPASGGASEDTPRAADAEVAADAVADELTSIKGLGARSAERLAEAGVTTLAQIAAWSEADIDEMAPRINVGAERIRREDWVGQAKSATKE